MRINILLKESPHRENRSHSRVSCQSEPTAEFDDDRVQWGHFHLRCAKISKQIKLMSTAIRERLIMSVDGSLMRGLLSLLDISTPATSR